MQARRLSSDVLGILSTRAAWTVLGMLTGVILARALGPSDRGVLALVLLAPATVMSLIKLGITQANVYCINRRREPAQQVAANSVALAVSLGAIAAALVWLAREALLSSVLRGVAPWALALALVRLPLMLIDDYLYGVLQATGRFALYNRRLIVSESLRLVLVFVSLVILKLGLAAAVLIYTAVTLFNVGWLLVATSRVLHLTISLDRRLLREQLVFGLKSYVQILTSHALLRVDVYMVSYFTKATDQVAFYSLALRFTELVMEFPQAVGLVLYPKLASLPEGEIHRLTAQACRRMLMVTGLGVVFLMLFGPWMITLWYGQAYAPAGAPLPWAAGGVIAMSIFVILSRAFTSQNRQQVNISAGIVALASEVVLNIFMIPRWGIVGAAMATTLSYSAACALLLTFYLIEARLSLWDVLIAKPEDLRYFWQTARRLAERGWRFAGMAAAKAG